MNFTDEEIRIKVAEACGTMRWSYALPTKCIGASVPNYPEDLNACAEFEAKLTDEEQAEYWKSLVTLCNEAARKQNNFRLVGIFYQITAKPKMRCLAFLKTKRLIP